MQWIDGIEEASAYQALIVEAVEVAFRGRVILVCGLKHLQAMKLAAGREQDLIDLRELGLEPDQPDM
jgi:hypothetical protein